MYFVWEFVNLHGSLQLGWESSSSKRGGGPGEQGEVGRLREVDGVQRVAAASPSALSAHFLQIKFYRPFQSPSESFFFLIILLLFRCVNLVFIRGHHKRAQLEDGECPPTPSSGGAFKNDDKKSVVWLFVGWEVV